MMELPLPAAAALNAALSRLFLSNDEARAALARHAGGVVAVELSSPTLCVHALVLEHTLEVLSVCEDTPDATVQTDWAGLLALSRGSDALLSGKARIRGDLRLVEGVHRALSLLAVDWEDQLAPFVGDTLAHKVSAFVDRLRADGARNRDRNLDDAAAYLKNETGLVVSRAEWRVLMDTSDSLRQDVDRLGARLAQLEGDT